MAEVSKDPDQSMEDILQSIKRIIADEGDVASPTVSGSDVLELTELLAEDVAITPPAPELVEITPEPEPEPEPLPEIGTMSIDEIMATPVSAIQQPVPDPEPEPEPVIASPAPMAAAPEPVVEAPMPTPPSPESIDKLMSDATLASAVAALHELSNAPHPRVTTSASPVFRSGTTVEDIVLEALKPMIREWLDGNLPALVRQLVEKEIRRMGGGA